MEEMVCRLLEKGLERAKESKREEKRKRRWEGSEGVQAGGMPEVVVGSSL